MARFGRRIELQARLVCGPAVSEEGSKIEHCCSRKPHSDPLWLDRKQRKRRVSLTWATVHLKCRRVVSVGILLLALQLHSQRNYSRPVPHCGRNNRHSREDPRRLTLFRRL